MADQTERNAEPGWSEKPSVLHVRNLPYLCILLISAQTVLRAFADAPGRECQNPAWSARKM